MLGAEIDFIVIEYDLTSNIAIASRKDAMELRATLEIPKLKVNDVVKVRIKNIDIKNNIFELFAKDFIKNLFKNIRKYITECGEYFGKVIAFPKK